MSSPGAKALSGVNLVRMGIAVATKSRGLRSGRAGSDYAPRSAEELREWLQTITAHLNNNPHGPEQLCAQIFGIAGVGQLVDAGALTTTSATRASRRGAGPSRIDAAGDDEDEEEEEPRPPKRRRM